MNSKNYILICWSNLNISIYISWKYNSYYCIALMLAMLYIKFLWNPFIFITTNAFVMISIWLAGENIWCVFLFLFFAALECHFVMASANNKLIWNYWLTEIDLFNQNHWSFCKPLIVYRTPILLIFLQCYIKAFKSY